jgi:hypothetical protein
MVHGQAFQLICREKAENAQRGKAASKRIEPQIHGDGHRSKGLFQLCPSVAESPRTGAILAYAADAFFQTSLGKRGFATCWRQTTYIRFDQDVGLSFWIAMQGILRLRAFAPLRDTSATRN